MAHLDTAIVAMKTVTLLLGGLITYFSLRAFQRTRSRALGALAAGFGIITAGSIFAGAMNLIFQIDLQYSVLLQSVATAIGFSVITYSIYLEE